MLKIESIDPRPLAHGSYMAAPTRNLPRIVSRTTGRPAAFGVKQPTRLRLVPARGFRAIERHPRRATMRLRIVESAYVAAAFGTALVIWWSAR